MVVFKAKLLFSPVRKAEWKKKEQPSTLYLFLLSLIGIFFNRQEAAGALWNLSFDDRNREAIAAAGGVEALVSFFS